MQKVRGDAAASRSRVAGSFSVLFLQGSFHLFPRGTLRCRSLENGSNLEGGPPGFGRKSLYSALLGTRHPGRAGVGFHHRRGRPFRGGVDPAAASRELRRRSLTTTGRLSVDWGWLGLVRCFSLPGWFRAERSLLRGRGRARAGGVPGRQVLTGVSSRGRSTRPSYRRGRRPDLSSGQTFSLVIVI